MKQIALFSVSLLCLISASPVQKAPGQPRVSANKRFLLTGQGKPLFLLCETAWHLGDNLSRDSVARYLDVRKAQHFNAVTFQAAITRKNIYGDFPFAQINGKYDPSNPIVTPGNNPGDSTQYDYWDNLDYVLDLAGEKGFYVILLPSWGSMVAGAEKGQDKTSIIFNVKNAYQYGNWLGKRYKNRTHIIWMLGGDISAVYPGGLDFRPVFRAMAEGIADGVNGENKMDGQANYSSTIMSYHPQKLSLQSSAWFHNNEWLDFNSIQEWPENQLKNIVNDYNLKPEKPTWVFEGRYEKYHRGDNKPEDWGPWQMRFQAYQTIFAGAFGYTNGHEYVFKFSGNWYQQLKDPGSETMQHITTLMQTLTDGEYINRVPAQEILDGDLGVAGRQTSTWQQATCGKDGSYAWVYAANGRNIRVKMQLLKSKLMQAYWFNPRSGKWFIKDKEVDEPTPFQTNIKSGTGASIVEFDPPGESQNENDWVLVLRMQK